MQKSARLEQKIKLRRSPYVKMPEVAKSPLAASLWNQDVGLGLEIMGGRGLLPAIKTGVAQTFQELLPPRGPKSCFFPTENSRFELPPKTPVPILNEGITSWWVGWKWGCSPDSNIDNKYPLFPSSVFSARAPSPPRLLRGGVVANGGDLGFGGTGGGARR